MHRAVAAAAAATLLLAVAQLPASAEERAPGSTSTVGWTPLVDTWQVTSLRGPFRSAVRNAELPLAKGESCGPTATAVMVGGIARAGGGSSIVTATCRPGESHVVLSFARLAPAGDYVGKIDLAPGADGGDVSLTVRRTDAPLWPLVVLVLGIGLAIAAAWQSGRLSALSSAQEEAWLLQAEAATAQLRFRVAGEGTTWRDYSLMSALTARLDEVRRALRRMRWQFGALDAERGPFRDQVDALTALRAAIDSWEPFAARLAALSAAASGAPAGLLADHADQILTGKDIADIDEVPTLAADAEATATALRAWTIDTRTASDLIALAAFLRPRLDSQERPRLDTATATVEALQDRMSSAEEGATYLGLHIADRLEAPRIEINALAKSRRLVSSGPQAAPTVDSAPAVPALGVPAILRTQAESATTTARRLARSRRLRNGLALAAIAAVTVWTGLSALYFGHAFGTWRDYGAVVMWGFGAQAGLTVLVGALDRVVAGGTVIRP